MAEWHDIFQSTRDILHQGQVRWDFLAPVKMAENNPVWYARMDCLPTWTQHTISSGKRNYTVLLLLLMNDRLKNFVSLVPLKYWQKNYKKKTDFNQNNTLNLFMTHNISFFFYLWISNLGYSKSMVFFNIKTYI